jgi:hypothetical protein
LFGGDIQWKTKGSGSEKRLQVFICFYHPFIEQETVNCTKKEVKKEANAYVKEEKEIIIPSLFYSDEEDSGEEEREDVQSSTNKRSWTESQTSSSTCTKRGRVQISEDLESDKEEEDLFQEAPAYNTRRACRQKDIE